MKVSCIQFDPVLGDVEANLRRMGELCPSDTDLAVYPEMATTGYLFPGKEALLPLAEAADGNSFESMVALAGERDCHIVYGFAEKDGDKLYNSAALVSPHGLVDLYRKVHMFGREHEIFEAGSEGWRINEIGGVRVGLMICFDWIMPEAARSLALLGADLICHPSNLVLHFAPDGMLTRSLENGLFTATCNRIGAETVGGMSYTYIGKSQIVSPRGERLAVAGGENEEVITAEIDPEVSRDKMITPHNHLFECRRPELYGKLSERGDE